MFLFSIYFKGNIAKIFIKKSARLSALKMGLERKEKPIFVSYSKARFGRCPSL